MIPAAVSCSRHLLNGRGSSFSVYAFSCLQVAFGSYLHLIKKRSSSSSSSSSSSVGEQKTLDHARSPQKEGYKTLAHSRCPEQEGVKSHDPSRSPHKEALLDAPTLSRLLPGSNRATFPTSFSYSDIGGITASFRTHGFAVLRDVLSTPEIAQLRAFMSATQTAADSPWDLSDMTHQYSQPLLDTTELDGFIRHPRSFPAIEAVLGGAGAARFSEFTLREVPPRHPPQEMLLHRDRALPLRALRAPYHPPECLCHHLPHGRDTARSRICHHPWLCPPRAAL